MPGSELMRGHHCSRRVSHKRSLKGRGKRSAARVRWGTVVETDGSATGLWWQISRRSERMRREGRRAKGASEVVAAAAGKVAADAEKWAAGGVKGGGSSFEGTGLVGAKHWFRSFDDLRAARSG